MVNEASRHHMPLVSIVSAYYNREAFVTESIGSLFTQTYSNIEIIVVDDGSRDGTLAALQALDDPRLKIITRPNTGFTAAINEAVRASRGEYVAIHGSGDLSLPNRIAEQAAVLREKPVVGVVGCWVENDEDEGGGTRLFKTLNGLPFRATLMERNLFTHGEVMFRRALYDQVGGYREFFRFSQDRDLWLRISRHAEYAIVPKLLYRRLKLPGGVSTSAEKLILQAYLSDFAVQCARDVDVQGRDLIDRHGNLAGFLRERRPEFARKMAWLGAKWMVRGEVERGWNLIRLARAERLSRSVAIIYALGALHCRPMLWRQIGRPVLARRLTGFRR